MTSHVDLDELVLKKGGHRKPSEGMCVMEGEVAA